MCRDRSYVAGFTLIELIIVIAIVSILAAVAIPSFLTMLPNVRLKGAARDLYANMQKAKITAVRTNRKTAVIFDTVNNRYQVCDNWDSSAVPPCVGVLEVINFSSLKSGIGYGHGNATADSTGAAFGPLDDDVSYNLPPNPPNVAIFDSQGLANAGYVYLDHKDNTLTYSIGSLTSGVIKLRKWNGGAWK